MSYINHDKVVVFVDKPNCEKCVNTPFIHPIPYYSNLGMCEDHTRDFLNDYYQKRRSKRYYEKNKEYVREKKNNWNKIKYVCECVKKITNGSKHSHKKSKFHLDYLNSKK